MGVAIIENILLSIMEFKENRKPFFAIYPGGKNVKMLIMQHVKNLSLFAMMERDKAAYISWVHSWSSKTQTKVLRSVPSLMAFSGWNGPWKMVEDLTKGELKIKTFLLQCFEDFLYSLKSDTRNEHERKFVLIHL